MKFLDVRCYIVFNVYIAYFSDLAAIRTNHVGLFIAIAPLVFRCGTELVVYYQIGVDKQCYCIVYCRTAYPELFFVLK